MCKIVARLDKSAISSQIERSELPIWGGSVVIRRLNWVIKGGDAWQTNAVTDRVLYLGARLNPVQ
jgi:hypothetical protein